MGGRSLYFYKYNGHCGDAGSFKWWKGDGPIVKISSNRLTTCSVAPDGRNIVLEFVDGGGATVTLELPFEQAEAVAMTLPHLLARALRQQTGDDAARYVFGLREWSIEIAKDQACLIATLKTADGFEVSFGIPFEASRSLGFNLLAGSDQSAEPSDVGNEIVAPDCIKFN